MRNPIEAFNALSKKQKIVVIGGAVVIGGGYSLYRHRQNTAASDTSTTDGETPPDEADTYDTSGAAYDSTYMPPSSDADPYGGIVPVYAGGPAELGGYGGLTPPVTYGSGLDPLTDPTTGMPDPNVQINIDATQPSPSVATGGGPPNRHHPGVTHRHPGRKARHGKRATRGARGDHPSAPHANRPHPGEHRTRRPVGGAPRARRAPRAPAGPGSRRARRRAHR